MLNLFKSKKPEVQVKVKSVNELIEEIHESFYTEVDKLLTDAKILNSLSTTKQSLLDKYERLKSLGFTNTKESIEANAEIQRLNSLSKSNAEKQVLVEAINYFSFKYPNYKFITEDSVKKICQKYNLIYGEVKRYIGEVPSKNLKHIEDFKIDEEDECYIKRAFAYSITSNPISEDIIGYSKAIAFKGITRHLGEVSEDVNKLGLEIAAPIKDFNTNGMEINEYKLSKIEIPDPVVLKPVFYKGNKYYLIVTAWGIEASDELVINHKLN